MMYTKQKPTAFVRECCKSRGAHEAFFEGIKIASLREREKFMNFM